MCILNLFIQAKALESANNSVFIERLVGLFKISEFTETAIIDKSQYVKNREKVAEKLYLKLQLYKTNAEVRNAKMSLKNEGLLQKLKQNDKQVISTLIKLQSKNKETTELIISLTNDNELLRKKIRKCEILNNLNLKCEEMAKIYKSIITGYEEQAHSLEKIYKLIK